MNVSPIHAGDLPAVAPAEHTVPLNERFTGALAGAYVQAGQDLAAIQAASNDPYTANSPERLLQLQLDLHDYTKRMMTTAGLTNHAVKTVETLLKS